MKDERIHLVSDLKNLSQAREFISKKAKEAFAKDPDITKIEISCDEWCASIIEHNLWDGVRKDFTIECRYDGSKFIVLFENEGERFNPVEQDEVNINEQFSEEEERRLGIVIMKEIMDEILYEYVEDRINRLTLVKKLR